MRKLALTAKRRPPARLLRLRACIGGGVVGAFRNKGEGIINNNTVLILRTPCGRGLQSAGSRSGCVSSPKLGATLGAML